MILEHVQYESSSRDDQLYLNGDLVCNDLRNCKMFINWMNLDFIKKTAYVNGGESYTITEYSKVE